MMNKTNENSALYKALVGERSHSTDSFRSHSALQKAASSPLVWQEKSAHSSDVHEYLVSSSSTIEVSAPPRYFSKKYFPSNRVEIRPNDLACEEQLVYAVTHCETDRGFGLVKNNKIIEGGSRSADRVSDVWSDHAGVVRPHIICFEKKVDSGSSSLRERCRRNESYEIVSRVKTECTDDQVLDYPAIDTERRPVSASQANLFSENHVGIRTEIQRSLSDDGPRPQECMPLDLSMATRRSSVESDTQTSLFIKKERPLSIEQLYDATSVDGYCTPGEAGLPPKMNLLQLADAVTYIIENDPQTSETFYSSRSSPSSFSDTNSSNSVDEKISLNEYRLSGPAIEFLTESRDGMEEESKVIKYEVSDSFQPEGIILNSNVLGDRVYLENGVNLVHQEMPTGHVDDCETSPTLIECGQGLALQSSARYVHVVSKNSAMPPRLNSTKPNSMTSGSRLGGTVIVSNMGLDSKRRLRLAKAEYESMSEEDRRVRHRVLDNQRSKQYRERRRRMVSLLQNEIAQLEEKNKSLKDTVQILERHFEIMKSAVQRTMLGQHLNEPILVSALC
ncbi:uncharacterized protein LOC108678532 [Hyalella azteca]|uniref:Uncharacterized protein LOC108678532 n=1 Tax=Hyalella azteca TaxID=294128 RepID=A0A979FNK1_HYAAZ|nr:uncharacterized protein LOC108678532 [Hyalella azteca]